MFIIRLTIADDDRIVVDGLVRMLQDEADISIVAIAADDGDLVAKLITQDNGEGFDPINMM